jgi:hypothetical protein
MQLFSIPNIVSHVATITDDVTLSKITNKRPLGMTKEQFRTHCAQASTQGNFLSVWEGVNPLARINTGNPPRMLHGIIADYDSVQAMNKLSSLPSSTGHLPMWIVETFTPGKCRAIWVFEKPVCVSNPFVTEGFLKELDSKLKISDALPGFDKASWKDSQVFEMGFGMHNIAGATPVPKALLAQCLMEGGIKAKVQVDTDPEIPMDVIAAEVERQFPGRWVGTFEEGKRGPLFWIPDGITRDGCAVAANGMICYSDRAASNFMPWRAVLGAKFVDFYETAKVGKAAEMYWTDGKAYWTNYSSPEWTDWAKEDAKEHLRVAGCSDKIRRGQTVSEVSKVIVYIQNNRRVAAAVPMLFMKDEIVPYNGRRYLNTSTKKAMEPAEDGDPKLWPWIHNYIMNGFDGEQDGIPAYEFFLGWFKRLWLTAYLGNPQQGQSIIIAGEAHTGKTFLSKCIIGVALGGSTMTEDLLLQKTKFNSQAAECAIWRCDDAISEGDYKTKQILAASLKAMAANPEVLYHPKYVTPTQLPFKGRVILTCNTDPESLKILPFLDGTIKDKLMLFRISPDFQPHFFNTNTENENRVLQELPHFLKHLMDYKVHPGVIDAANPRFEIKSFHHKLLVAEANSEQRESILAEVIASAMVSQRTIVKKGEKIKLTATEIIGLLEGAGYGKTVQQLGGAVYIGKMLNKVIEQKLSVHMTKAPSKSMGRTKYTIDPWAEEDHDLQEAA